MTPEIKAKKLLEEMCYRSPGTLAGRSIAKDHAIFCCNEIIEFAEVQKSLLRDGDEWGFRIQQQAVLYFEKVKTEIEKL